MSTTNQPTDLPQPPEIRKITPEEWKIIAERGLHPIWMTALISLDIFPISPRDIFERTLCAHNEELYRSYCRRRDIIHKNYSHHQHLPAIDHELAGKSKYSAILDIYKFQYFAIERHLHGIEPLIDALKPSTRRRNEAITNSSLRDETTGDSESPKDQSIIHYSNSLPFGAIFIQDIEEKGNRYACYFLGAAIEVLQQSLIDPKFAAELIKKKNKNINYFKLSEKIQEILSEAKIKTMGDKTHSAAAILPTLSSAHRLVHGDLPE